MDTNERGASDSNSATKPRMERDWGRYRDERYDPYICEMNKWFPFFLGSTSSLVLVAISLTMLFPGTRAANASVSVPTFTAPPAAVVPAVPVDKNILASESKITGIVDSATMTASYYWTLGLRGNYYGKQEAVFKMRLPEGAAITRATLWVKGAPQEAAFNETSLVEHAYHSVVARMRDPLLIKQLEDGLVEIRAFPIENYKELKLRIGITAALRAEGSKFSVPMPSISDANFDFTSAQSVHFESDVPLVSGSRSLNPFVQEGKSFIDGDVSVEKLSKLKISGARSLQPVEFATRATHSYPRGFIVARLEQGNMPGRMSLSTYKTLTRPDCKLIDSEHAAHRLSKVWAMKEIKRLLSNGDRSMAAALGMTYRIISPVTSATVLETDQDYTNFGLHRDLYKSLSYNGRGGANKDKKSESAIASVGGFEEIGPSADLESSRSISPAPKARRKAMRDDRMMAASMPSPRPSATPSNEPVATRQSSNGIHPRSSSFGARFGDAFSQGNNLSEYNQGTQTSQIAAGNAPVLQGSTNGTIGPQGGDAEAIMGVNTSGTVVVVDNRVHLRRTAEIFKILGTTFGLIFLVLSMLSEKSRPRPFKRAALFLSGGLLVILAFLSPTILECAFLMMTTFFPTL